jgi:exodeoxyribonuclease-5
MAMVFEVSMAGVTKGPLSNRLNNFSARATFAAYTGKAALVMRQKGCTDATTIHSLIYQHQPASSFSEEELAALGQKLARGCQASIWERRRLLQTFRTKDPEDPVGALAKAWGGTEDAWRSWLFRKDEVMRFTLNNDANLRLARTELLIIDECSMVDEQIGRDLLSFGKPILVLGDPAQLPPVKNECGFFTNVKPEVMLTEVHRQAAENPIIALSIHVRQGGTLYYGSWGTVRIVSINQLAGVDPRTIQVLVGTNATRRAYNGFIRCALGLATELPMAGDKIVCRRNEHDRQLWNGSIWRVINADPVEQIRVGDKKSHPCLPLEIESLDEDREPVIVRGDPAYLLHEKIHEFSGQFSRFLFGQALTVHLAQGSQWEDAMLMNEAGCFRADAVRWLYTGITRAAERLTIVTLKKVAGMADCGSTKKREGTLGSTFPP